jgi:hypothetical protein
VSRTPQESSSSCFPYHLDSELSRPIHHIECPGCGSIYDYPVLAEAAGPGARGLFYSRFGNQVFGLPLDYEEHPDFKREIDCLLKFPKVFRKMEPLPTNCPCCEYALSSCDISAQSTGGKINVIRRGPPQREILEDPRDAAGSGQTVVYGKMTRKGLPYKVHRALCHCPIIFACPLCRSAYPISWAVMDHGFGGGGCELLYSRFGNILCHVFWYGDQTILMKNEIDALLNDAPEVFKKAPGFSIKATEGLVCPYCSTPLSDVNRKVERGFADTYWIDLPYDAHAFRP